MKFALVENKKIEATKGAKGNCPCCGSEVIAKCGAIKINHWAHKKISTCDPWWERETEWHRAWKNNYPDDWQEISFTDEQTGEKHIADVRTSHNLIIEFQHSHIEQQERVSRERFYKNMVWVVDGTRLKRDYPRFLKGKDDNIRLTNKQGFFTVNFPDECFPSAWLESSVPVIFDFLGMESIDNLNDFRNNLYCLLPKQNKRESILVVFLRESFIQGTVNGVLLFNKQQDSQKQNTKPPTQNKTKKSRSSSHYYDPRKGQFVKKRRL